MPDPNTKDAYTHNWFVGAQMRTAVGPGRSRRTTSATSGATSGAWSTTTPCAGDLFDGRLDRLNPSFGGINYRAMLARTRVPRPAVAAEQALLSDGFTGQVSYTLGKAMDNGSDVQVGGMPVDARNLDLEWALVGLRRASPPRGELAVGGARSSGTPTRR